jgi:hypothetical protein
MKRKALSNRSAKYPTSPATLNAETVEDRSTSKIRKTRKTRKKNKPFWKG